ncbi:hypothetical protein [Pseudomonas rhodesiae]|uniref:hypothetical protein n=1 Tax=Pseudomonas rhodesiae TaxID=76760 RepID=UPI00209DC4D8|nr:hypothetical protein [Pseudomonas rhodesiae]MCP1515560.1 hypothetical protein [Pseudomonas rhodesiae]MDF9772963.1 hypothetical protein [Pseudomonas rhodesiae]
MMSVKKDVHRVHAGLQWTVKTRDVSRQLRWGFSVSLERQQPPPSGGRSLLRVYLQTEVDGDCKQVLDTHLFGQDDYLEACCQAKAFIRNNVTPLIPELVANLFIPPDDVNARAVNACDLSRVIIRLQ